MSKDNAIQAVVGLALIVAGVAQVSIPAAFIVPGALLFLLAVIPSRTRSR